MSGFVLRCLAGVALGWAASGSVSALAEPAVSIEIDGPDKAETRLAIERELASITPAPSGALTVHRTSDAANLVFIAEDGRKLERSIRIQAARSDAAEEIALLAANLARDDASLIHDLPDSEDQGGSDAPASPEPPEPTPPPAQEPSAESKPPESSAAPRTPPRAYEQADDVDPCAQEIGPLPIGFDVAPYVGMSSSPRFRNATRVFAFNLLGGIGRGLKGVEIGTALNLTTGPVCGAQVSAGVDISGRTTGLQIAGASAIATKRLEGVQASAVNVVVARLDGLQVAGAVNVVAGTVRGAQFAGAVNVASGEVRGAQVAPINVAAGRVRGVQIGVVNIAEKSDLSIGVVNVNYKGRTHVDVWSDLEVGMVAAAVKHGGDHWHSFYGIATRVTDPGFIAILGLGGHERFSKWLFLDFDALGHLTSNFSNGKNGTPLVQARPVMGFNLVAPFAIYAGAAFNALLVTGSAKDWSPSYAVVVGRAHLWPGAVFGLQAITE